MSELEAETFAQAVAAGELVLTPDVPISSELPVAWWRYCQSAGLEYKVRGSQDSTLKVWDAQKGHEVLTLQGTGRPERSGRSATRPTC
jgi:hypothetical protein